MGTLFFCRSGKVPKGRVECRTRRREQGAEQGGTEQGTLSCSLGRPAATEHRDQDWHYRGDRTLSSRARLVSSVDAVLFRRKAFPNRQVSQHLLNQLLFAFRKPGEFLLQPIQPWAFSRRKTKLP